MEEDQNSIRPWKSENRKAGSDMLNNSRPWSWMIIPCKNFSPGVFRILSKWCWKIEIAVDSQMGQEEAELMLLNVTQLFTLSS